jgi:ribose transport system substrate-binding protein
MKLRLAFVAAAVAVVATTVLVANAPAKSQAGWVIGVSNTHINNGWREEMICSIKAEALVSGKVSKVILANRETDVAGQVADIRNLISAGANAIIINPASPTALNTVIAQAASRGIKVISVDQRVTAPQAYNATNDQENYGYLGAKWLFQTLKGKGSVVEMRGFAGVPADTDRHHGFQRALKQFPGIKVAKSVFTSWDFQTAAKQMLDILNSGTQVDGVWTSGADYTVTSAFKTAGKPLVPIVGADTNEFLHQQIMFKSSWHSAATTNPATIGGVGASMAIKLLSGGTVPKWVKLKPAVWDNGTAAGLKNIKANYSPSRPPTYSARLTIAPWTHYTPKQLFACKGP